jgi:hypothetical protein
MALHLLLPDALDMNKSLFHKIQERFLTKIAEKNSWGKNEIKQLWQATVSEVLVENLTDE